MALSSCRPRLRHRTLPQALGCLLGAIALVTAPTARGATGPEDCYGYTWADNASGCPTGFPAFGAGAQMFLGATDVVGPIPLGFTMPWYGRPVSQVWISPAGYVTFSDQGRSENTPQALPDARRPDDLFAAYWISVDNSDITTEALGTEFHVKWRQVPNAAIPTLYTEIDLMISQDGGLRIGWTRLVNLSQSTIGHEDPLGACGRTIYRDATGEAGFPGPTIGGTLCITHPRLLDCSGPVDIACDAVEVSSLPGNGARETGGYTCDFNTWAATERVFALTVSEFVDATITVTPAAGENLGVFFFDTCDETACIEGGPTSISVSGLTPGAVYYVVVDGLTAADEGSFDLEVTCTAISEPITCEETLAGTTVGGLTLLDSYGCLPGDFSGSESYYTIDFVPPGNINATLTSGTGQGVFIFDGSQPLDPASCLRGGVGGTVLYDPTPGTYLIVVDGPPGGDGAFTLTVNCQPEIECAVAVPLGCNDSLVGSTAAQPSFVDFYRCSGLQYSGPEVVYEFTNPTDQVVSFLLDDSAEPGLDLILLSSCNEGACEQIGDNEVSKLLAPGTYYLVVDGLNGASGAYGLSTICGNGIEPAFISVTAAEGQCFTEHKTVWLTPEIPQGDVLFAIDLTGSMSQERARLQANMQDIIDRLQTFIQDVNFGLVSYKDYVGSGSGTVPCTYNAGGFGSIGDYPYRLEQPITADRTAIQDAVNNLPAASGGNDAPESYNRMMYESYSDAGIGWRPGSRRLLVDFGDELPHDCNVLSCFGEIGGNRGIDLGRDGLVDTGDELSTADVIQGLADNNIVLLHLDSSGGFGSDGGHTYREIWDCWAAMTGGESVQLNTDGSVPAGIDLAELVGELIEEQGSFCSELELIAEPGFESWLVSATPIYFDTDLPTVVEFDIEICVPVGTPPGTYSFEVQAVCSGGFVVAQQVNVEVSIDCAPSVVAPPSDSVICLGDGATLDASGMSLVNCGGSVDYEWRDGGAVVGVGPIVSVNPAVTTTYDVSVTCSTDPACLVTDSATVDVHAPPLFDVASVRDPAPCNGGLEVSWEAATFLDPTGTGVYNVYRSEVSCADALSRPPLARGLTDLRWVDTTTRDGRAYVYVVEAEDARNGTACVPAGPNNGGAVTRICLEPAVREVADLTPPDGVFVTLRARHVGQEVTLYWDGARALLAEEHFHLLKAVGTPTAVFGLVNGEADLSRSHTETDTTARVQFFDLRVANTCEVESEDEFPAGFRP